MSLLLPGGWPLAQRPGRTVGGGDELTEHLRREGGKQARAPHGTWRRGGARPSSPSPSTSRWGGFGKAPKFYAPQSGVPPALRRAHRDSHCREMAEKTLDAMYRGGLFDHVGGGFSRYSTDDHWLAPPL